MQERFDKLPYRTCVGDLEISLKNRQYIERFIQHLKGYVAESRMVKYRHALTRFAHLVEKDFDQLTYDDVRTAGGIINQSSFSTVTKKDIMTGVKTAFKFWFGKNRYIPEVVSGLKPPTEKGSLRLPTEMPTEADVYRMIKAAQNARDKFFIALIGLDGALRPIEARRIRWGDIKKDKYGHFITIRTAKKSGDKETRTVRLIRSEPYFVGWNQAYPAEKLDDAFVFINLSDLQPISQGTITSLFARLKKKLSLKRMHPYLLRHQWITRASKDPNWTEPLLKRFIGHSLRSNTIAEYQHFGDDDLKDAQLRVNGIIKDDDEQEPERRPVACPKCKTANEYDAEFCSLCNMALSQKRMVKLQDTLEENNRKMYEKVKEMMEEMLTRSSEAQRADAA